ncbi:hypothetical protein GALL_405190 [mine drainage metagenome]|uniref:Uncharacterized protein n=1 Tax=mine drainage metagenome TaxID=410659 RepID=A0A1J5Q255_9ZZZZ
MDPALDWWGPFWTPITPKAGFLFHADQQLMERSAFSALFEFGGNLRNMPAQGNMNGAIENAAQFAQAVYRRLAGEM